MCWLIIRKALNSKPSSNMQRKYEYIFRWLPLSRFLAKILRVDKIVTKSFSKICRTNSILTFYMSHIYVGRTWFGRKPHKSQMSDANYSICTMYRQLSTSVTKFSQNYLISMLPLLLILYILYKHLLLIFWEHILLLTSGTILSFS